ncbi:MAG TPA: tetratricopeptide repeat protein, partial [Gemmatimonadales bacterium]|nr:tetratricopeptide repeat protein [Gemmatimonadales bacterium]
MAWRKIAVLLGNEFRERDRALRAIETAYRHRSRLTEMERLLTEGYYHTRGPSPDPDRALAAYEQVLLLDSTSVSAMNNAAVVYGQKRDFVRAERLYRQAIQLPRTFGGAFTNLIQVQIRNGRPPEALDSTAAAYRQRFPNSNDIWEAEWYAVWGKGDLERADSISRAVLQQARTLRQQTRATGTLSSTAALRGRPREALASATRSAEASLRALQTAGARARFAGDSAFHAALFSEDPEATRAFLARGEARVPIAELPATERPWGFYARLAAVIRDPALARRALEGYERDEAALAADAEGRRAFHEAHLALAEGRWDDAIRLLHEADRRLSIYFRYAWVQIGRAHDLAGRPDSAIAYLQRYVDTPDPNPGEDSQWLARTHKRLGELYEAKGDAERAIANYARFVNLWRNAEPELQPQVRDVNQRLERLRAGRG